MNILRQHGRFELVTFWRQKKEQEFYDRVAILEATKLEKRVAEEIKNNESSKINIR